MAKTESRKRGRPRQSASPQQPHSEKRRNQLRLAQRAYRGRKEQTISTLQARTKELEEGIDKLSQMFITFSGMLLKTDLKKDPDVMLNLHQINQMFVSLAKVRSDSEPPPEVNLTSENLSSARTGCESQTSTLVSSSLDSLIPLSRSTSQTELTIPPSLTPDLITLSSMPILTFTQHLVRTGTQNGYRLLTSKSNNAGKLQEIFGYQPTPDDRSLLSIFFRAILHDVNAIEARTYALSASRPENNISCQEDYLKMHCISDPEDYLDAQGVLEFLRMNGVSIQGNTPTYPMTKLHITISESSNFNPIKFINILAKECSCIGSGPAFRRCNVEAALRLATHSVDLSRLPGY
ncbi:hypothetical protein BDV28DRAFT_78072 [Aspergillus coremiiformis]|uniref:BZIP domain-containing protein n=1 Tax=Aspergillus coremiiformis TaxID=138285 RepID=A0A5N6ZA89_9EURO|nr:hypothetical protein BDV28DRAFT_78072 [Aspergillus coremiiformis]